MFCVCFFYPLYRAVHDCWGREGIGVRCVGIFTVAMGAFGEILRFLPYRLGALQPSEQAHGKNWMGDVNTLFFNKKGMFSTKADALAVYWIIFLTFAL